MIHKLSILMFIFFAQFGYSQIVKIGSKKFTENVILGEIAFRLGQDQGLEIEHQKELGGTRILWEALLRGDLDLYPEYTGTLSHQILQNPQLRSIAEIRSVLEPMGIGITEPFGFNNTYALGMRTSEAQRLSIRTVSDLKLHPELVFGLGHEFLDRKDGWPGLQQRYGLNPRVVKGMDHDIAYKAITSGSIQVIDLYTTDAEIDAYDLLALEDNKKFFPEYKALFLYRLDAPKKLRTIANSLAGTIDTKTMIVMNRSHKIEGMSAEKVAKWFLKKTFDREIQVQEKSRLSEIARRSLEHLTLFGISMVAAIMVSIPLGYYSAKWTLSKNLVLSAVGLIQTIPSLALLVLMIPLFGIGMFPALVALFLYSLLPIVRGTYLGFSSIPQEIREAAVATGLPESKRLRKIFWPLALPSILSGIKTSAVINVGTATLGALIGAGGYGQTILRGIRLDDSSLILAGAIPSAVLALLVQGIFDLIEKMVVSRGLSL